MMMTVGELSELTGLSRHMVHKYLADNGFEPAMVVGGIKVYERSALERALRFEYAGVIEFLGYTLSPGKSYDVALNQGI